MISTMLSIVVPVVNSITTDIDDDINNRLGAAFVLFVRRLVFSDPGSSRRTPFGPHVSSIDAYVYIHMQHHLLYYTILYYTMLYYIILYYTILYYTILYYTILHYTILYYTIIGPGSSRRTPRGLRISYW